ncbi:3-hydroxy-3-methylglutaryl-coenzyme A (HMG-CoA) reductase isozyme [Scheffersomyces spartinae]|uniref:3-hydroxy-3-methylglutaryl coenzyme A reductase n=1 Tax=Scheffersomyces spartinae TaxID=45513 RepID=A0A9P8AKD7_9ASCO|nr:3-hydroxy-3-methylglutaryl-coenzyme A (HMG-CoA) reductase isozyme [Scheffersomyces spartinae]KAG7195738.1 3-hydroxy-3-methylglutaryl-coenzyme A (HMG-CoA) reductase isozyme [Scheffersomyces spartinae]
MLNVTRAVARMSAQRPIHVIIMVSLMASIAYLKIVDEYLPSSLRGGSSSYVAYYHPPSKSADYSKWLKLDGSIDLESDSSPFKGCHMVAVKPLVFKSVLVATEAPELPLTYPGPVPNERVLVVAPDKLDDSLRAIESIKVDGVDWKARSDKRMFKYYEYLNLAIARLVTAIQEAESFDIMLITVAYIAMLYTLIKVFVDMKKAGSNFWLGFSALCSSTCAFLIGWFVTNNFLTNDPVTIRSISEGIPFLVAIVGFKHKVSIANVVMSASMSSTVDVPTIVAKAVSSHTLSFLRDSFVVIGALLACVIYAPHLIGLQQFCVFGSVLLTFDVIFTYTFYSAILALKVEINRARRTETLQEALEEDGINNLAAQKIATGTSEAEFPNEKPIFTTSIISFKVGMIAAFFAFHIFWLGSSWLYTSSTSTSEPFKLFVTLSPKLTPTAVKHVSIGKKGTVALIYSPTVFMPMGFFVQAEDIAFGLLQKVSAAVRDSFISKCLLFGFAISISSNVYFLNAARSHRNTASILINQEISKSNTPTPCTTKDETVSKLEVHEKKAGKKKKAKNQPNGSINGDASSKQPTTPKSLSLEKCTEYLKEGRVKELNDSDVSLLVIAGKLPLYALEKQLGDTTRAVVVRRKAIANLANAPILETDRLPYEYYDYDRVFGACCENVIGFIPLPVGVAGPLIIDDIPYHIPMATTEGCLVASTMRGCKAINAGGGVQTVLTKDGMTRGPCVRFPTLKRAGACKIWLDSEEGQKVIKKAFNSTSRFARLQHIQTALAGTTLFIRFRTTTGDAMGMNMISKGVEHSLKFMVEECGWEDMETISVSGNYCTDKKPAAINWIEGRGKSIVAEARVPADAVRRVLKSDVDALVELNIHKNLIGSAMAGSVGGFNAHAANLVTAVYLACGQDPAQNVESSNCITLMSKDEHGNLQISVSMPSIEVGTIGGGTILEPQGAMLDLLGVRGPHATNPGENARTLARIVASAVLAAELSLCSALAAGHLVQSHMQHNRKGAATPAATPNGAIESSTEELKRLKEGSTTCIKS